MIGEPQFNRPASYDAGAFHPLIDGNRASGKLRLSPAGASFESEKGTFDLPLAGLRIGVGDASDPLIFFSHPQHPDTTIHTSDHSVLNDPVLLGHPELLAQVARIKGRKPRVVTLVILIAVALIAVLVGLIISKALKR